MQKNVASQKIQLFAFDTTTGAPKTGDAANITAYVSKDHGAVTVLGDTSAAEMDSTNAKGVYVFDLTQAETNADELTFSAKSSTSNVSITPRFVTTTPPNFSVASIDSNGRLDIIKVAGTTQTAGDIIGDTNDIQSRLPAALTADGNIKADTLRVGGTLQTARDIGASVLLSSGTGTGQLDFTSGVVKGNLVSILGTALTETSGQIAAAFKKFFDKATPTGTINSIPDAVAGASGGLFIAGTNAATTVTTSFTTTFTGNVTGNVGGNVTGSVGSLATQAKADVNAEVLDVLNTDTFAEPGQGAPAATATLAAKINYLYKAWRNKKTQTSTTWSLFADDASTVDQKSTVSDDGTTATRGEIATGP